MCIKSIPVPYVLAKEWYLIGRVGRKEFSSYLCIIRYVYHDTKKDNNDFEDQLICNVGDFIYSKERNSYSISKFLAEEKMVVMGTPILSGNAIDIFLCFDFVESLHSTTLSYIMSPIIQNIIEPNFSYQVG